MKFKNAKTIFSYTGVQEVYDSEVTSDSVKYHAKYFKTNPIVVHPLEVPFLNTFQ